MRYLFVEIAFTSWYLMARGEISLPFGDGVINGVRFDGQPIQLYMDTGLSGTYVVYKDWYERTYGKDACKQFKMGCYSCPGECKPYAEEKNVGTFGDMSMITSVLHKGTLTLGGYQLDMQFRLIIGFSPGERGMSVEPKNFLGLAFPSVSSLQTVPEHLFSNKIIKKYAVSICSPTDVESFTGTLILGDWVGLCAIKSPVTTIPMTKPRETNLLDSDLSSYGLVSLTGTTFTQEVQQGSVAYDAGAYAIAVPRNIFDTLLNKILASAGPGVQVEFRGNRWYITDSSLPTLTFSVGSKQRAFIIRIPPNKYAIECDGKWCELLFIDYGGSKVLLGRPFFAAYFSSFNLEFETVSIAEYTTR